MFLIFLNVIAGTGEKAGVMHQDRLAQTFLLFLRDCICGFQLANTHLYNIYTYTYIIQILQCCQHVNVYSEVNTNKCKLHSRWWNN